MRGNDLVDVIDRRAIPSLFQINMDVQETVSPELTHVSEIRVMLNYGNVFVPY